MSKKQFFYVRITGFSEPHFWYQDYIGAVFPVTTPKVSKDRYDILDGMGTIRVADCERVEIMVKEKGNE